MRSVLVVSTKPFIAERYCELEKRGAFPPYRPVFLIGSVGKSAAQPQDDIIYVDDIGDPHFLDGVIEEVRARGPFEHVVSVDEFSVCAAGRIREALGVPGSGIQDALKFRDKVVMKTHISSRLKKPKMYSSEELRSGNVKFPLVAKPRAYAGGFGVMLLNSMLELVTVLNANSSEFREFDPHSLEFEEFISGEIYHIDGLVADKAICFFNVSKYTADPLVVYHQQPLGSFMLDNKTEIESWRVFSQIVVDDLAMPNGAFHLEAFQCPNGDRVFLEVGIRPGGALVIPTVEAATGLDLEEAHIQLQLGGTPNLRNCYDGKVGGWLVFPRAADNTPLAKKKQGLVVEKSELVDEKQIHSLHWKRLPKPGESITGPISFTKNLGSFMYIASSTAEIEKDIHLTIKNYKVIESQIRESF